jgi:hypothetical protein
MLNKCIDTTKEGCFSKKIKINDSQSRHIKTIATSIFILSVVQGIEPSKVLAFDVIPIEAVSTTVNSPILPPGSFHIYTYDFQVNVSNYPELDPMAKLVEFTVLFARTKGNYHPGGTQPVSKISAPSNWQLSEIGQATPDLCVGDPKANCYLSPTVTFQATNPNAGISPGTSLEGFHVTYNTACGIYCSPLGSNPSVIAVSSVPVPEPVTILGSAIALGFGITVKRKYSKIDSTKT